MKVNPDIKLGFMIAVGVMAGMVAFRFAEHVILRGVGRSLENGVAP